MQIIELSITWTIIVDILAWGFFHMGISLLTFKMPDRYFDQDNALYQIRSWEMGGHLWQKYFSVKKWKNIVPDGARVFGGFEKRHLRRQDTHFLETFVLESRRAELTHWLCIPPAGLFFLWNPVWAGWIMVIYALVVNVPIIILQRYNRARLQRVLMKNGERL